jgi:hypothetical protein
MPRAKTLFVLDNEAYGQAAPDGGPLKVRRLTKAGRVELLQVINDPPSYWFVRLRRPRNSDSVLLRNRFGGGRYGYCRFVDRGITQAHFEAMAAVSQWAGKARRTQKVFLFAEEVFREVQSTGRNLSSDKRVHFSASNAIAGHPSAEPYPETEVVAQ